MVDGGQMDLIGPLFEWKKMNRGLEYFSLDRVSGESQ
jgi:hypothetical protein